MSAADLIISEAEDDQQNSPELFEPDSECFEPELECCEEEEDDQEQIIPAKRARPNNPFAEELEQDIYNGNDITYMESRFGTSKVSQFVCPDAECGWVSNYRSAGAFVDVSGTVRVVEQDETPKCDICGSTEDFVEEPNLLVHGSQQAPRDDEQLRQKRAEIHQITSTMSTQVYDKFCCFVMNVKNPLHFSSNKLIVFLTSLFIKVYVFENLLLFLRSGVQASALLSISALYRKLKQVYVNFDVNHVYTKATNDGWPDLVELFMSNGQKLIDVGEISEKPVLDIASAGQFCCDFGIVTPGQLYCIYKKIKTKKLPSPDKRLVQQITPCVMDGQFNNAQAVFESGAGATKLCNEIVKAGTWESRNQVLKRTRISFIFKCFWQHSKCCIINYAFNNEIFNGIDLWLKYNDCDYRYFSATLMGCYMGIEKSPRNMLLFSDHQSIGKSTLAHAIGDLVFPQQSIGSLCLSEGVSNRYLLGLCKDRSLIITDDVSSGDYLSLAKTQDIFDGIFASGMNEKYGNYCSQVCPPHVMTSNKIPVHQSTLHKRLEIMILKKPRSLKEFCSKDKLPCSLVQHLLGWCDFSTRMQLPESDPKYPKFDPPTIGKQKLQTYVDTLKCKMVFVKSPHGFVDDKVIIKIGDFEEVFIRKECEL